MERLIEIFEDKGYEVLSVSRGKKNAIIIRTTRGEFRNSFPVEFTTAETEEATRILREAVP